MPQKGESLLSATISSLLPSPPFLDSLGDSIDGTASCGWYCDEQAKAGCHAASDESANGSKGVGDGTCGS